jgi:hypothetical protein
VAWAEPEKEEARRRRKTIYIYHLLVPQYIISHVQRSKGKTSNMTALWQERVPGEDNQVSN